MKENYFNPQTMTRATSEDIFRIWRELWGDATPEDISEKQLNPYMYGMETLDETQQIVYDAG